MKLRKMKLRKMEAGEVCQPVMDDYIMGCCDCGLQHRVKFRAIEVTNQLGDEEFEYTELDPEKYRVEMTQWRHSENSNMQEVRRLVAALTQMEHCDCGCPKASKPIMQKPVVYFAVLNEIKRLLDNLQ
jgi:hypothetical protein